MSVPTSYQQQFTGKTLVAGSLRVYRVWEPYVPLVGSRGVEWFTIDMNAECLNKGCGCEECMDGMMRHKAKVPKRNCTCGIYGYYSPEFKDVDPAYVHGTVRVTGKILIGELGVRAAHAEIESLLLTEKHDHWEVTLKDLRSCYPGVPVYRSKKKWLAEFPPESVNALLNG